MSSISRKNMNIAKQEQKAYNDLMKDVEKKIDQEYAKAHADLAKKTEDYFRRFEKKDAIWQGWVESGEKSKEEYRAWRAGQMAMGKRWEDMRDTIASDLAHSDQIAAGIVNNSLPDAYALGHNWGTYQVETNIGINTGYTLYNHEAVEQLLKKDLQLLPMANPNIPKDKRWNRQHLDSAITQGILQGESIPDIAKRLEDVTDMNHKAALRNARTMTGSAQNAGHFDAYKRAENMGIELEKQWVATFDGRTRTSHRYLHGETQPMDEPFSNGLMYPKDPWGAAEEVYNCRCRLISNVTGYHRDVKGIYNEELMGMSYEEWLDATPVSQSITHGEEVAQAQKMRYIREYRNGANKKRGSNQPQKRNNRSKK